MEFVACNTDNYRAGRVWLGVNGMTETGALL